MLNAIGIYIHIYKDQQTQQLNIHTVPHTNLQLMTAGPPLVSISDVCAVADVEPDG